MPSILHPVPLHTGHVRVGNEIFEFVDGRVSVPHKLGKDNRKALERQGFSFSDSQPEDDDYVDVSFDPSERTVEDVTAYLDAAPAAERERVLDAEAAGKARKTVADWKPAEQS